MAYSSSSHTYRYDVFASFHHLVRQTFLSHLQKQLNDNAITMFDDRLIVRTQAIGPATLMYAIRESRISIVVLTKNYASSGWCLDELLEILKCREEIGQIVMTVFYGVDPSDVEKQTGDFGMAFDECCTRKTEEQRQRWSQALTDVAKIEGEQSINRGRRANEADMIKHIARNVLEKLNATISWDFEDMVGIEAHLEKMQSLLHLEHEDEAMIVGICGPSGIGKTTIARALHSRLSSRFQHTCFMENLGGIHYNSDLDEYGLKLQLQEQLLSKIWNQNAIRISHLRAIQERLCDQIVLIVLDDVDELQQLEALADETSWFGPRSRIIVTTQDPEHLRQHGIDITYHVDLPSDEEALEILCRYAFKQSNPKDDFRELAVRVTEFCGKLPLRLREVGSFLRGKKKEEWEKLLGVENEPRGKSKSWRSTGMAFLVVINLLIEITAAVSEQLSSVRKPNFARISLAMSVLSVVLSIFDLTYKIRADKARFRWTQTFGRSTDTTLLFCGVGQLIVSITTCVFIESGQESPINVAVFPLFFAIGMVISKFMEKPAALYEETLPVTIKSQ